MTRLPSKSDLLDWIRANPHAVNKREIARAFGLKGVERVHLKALLAELEQDGTLLRRRRKLGTTQHLPPVLMLVGGEPTPDGDLTARPKDWDSDEAPPAILVVQKRGEPPLGPGDRFLARLSPVEHDQAEGLIYEARMIKKVGAGARKILGIFREEGAGGRIVPVDRKADREWMVPPGATGGAKHGELVEGEATDSRRMGLPRAKVTEILGNPEEPRQVSLIAIHRHDIPLDFPDAVEAEAEAATLPGPEGREDLTGLPLLTIDPADARDHDDAVAAEPDTDPKNPGGHVVWVAIADVAWFVRPGTPLDREARKRGNSTYFPDRVAPMLPESLSGDLCSLHDGVDRPCLALRMVLDARGEKIGHRFLRGIMRSAASLTYEQAQAIETGDDAIATPDVRAAVRRLFTAYRSAATARDRRQPLDLDLPERKIELAEDGTVTAIRLRERFDAHRLIEEFMILANVAAAESLEGKRRGLVYRIHEEPNPDKLDALRESVETLGLTLAKGQVLKTAHLNRLLAQARDTDAAEMVNMGVLRSQTQAYYAPENLGHFGLNLARYAHFTSPIRRYADLIVHRALIAALGLGPGGQTPEEAENLKETAEHISRTERRSMEAERETVDRYLASYLGGQEGAEFDGKISGIQRFGLFVNLAETGADGLVPVGSLGTEYWHHDPESQTLTGDRSGRVLSLGLPCRVRLVEATPATGGLIFELIEADGSRTRPRGTRGPAPRRKLGRARIAAAKARKKEKHR